MKRTFLFIAIIFSLSAFSQSKIDASLFSSYNRNQPYTIEIDSAYSYKEYYSNLYSQPLRLHLTNKTLSIDCPFFENDEIKTITIGGKIYELKTPTLQDVLSAGTALTSASSNSTFLSIADTTTVISSKTKPKKIKK